MNQKLEAFKNGLSSIVDLCHDIDSTTFIDAVTSIMEEAEELETDDDMERALSLLEELIVHVNDLDDEFTEPYSETIADIHELADEIRNDANCS